MLCCCLKHTVSVYVFGENASIINTSLMKTHKSTSSPNMLYTAKHVFANNGKFYSVLSQKRNALLCF